MSDLTALLAHEDNCLYIGTKLIAARPMSRADYNIYRGWELPSDEDGTDEGYLVEYVDDGASNHPDHKGYISWFPKDVFTKAYLAVDGGVPFNLALSSLKLGFKIARQGWNGKGMFIYLVGPGRYPPSTEAGHQIADEHEDGLVPYRPYIAMKTVNGEVVPWVASQSDLLEDDWVIRT